MASAEDGNARRALFEFPVATASMPQKQNGAVKPPRSNR